MGSARPGPGIERPEDQPVHPGRHQRAGTHRAGLERHHQGDSGQPPPSECNGGITECQDFGVGRRVPGELTFVVPGGQQSTVEQGDGADRDVAVRESGPRLGQGE